MSKENVITGISEVVDSVHQFSISFHPRFLMEINMLYLPNNVQRPSNYILRLSISIPYNIGEMCSFQGVMKNLLPPKEEKR